MFQPGVPWCGAQDCATFMSPICTLSTSALIGLVPICVLVQAPFIVWIEPIVRALDCEWLVVYLSQKHPSDPICRMGFCFISQDFLV